MREIKFRGYAVPAMVNSQWQYGFGISECEFSEEYAERLGRKSDWLLHGDSAPIDVHEKSIGQYAGLNDMNGIEIYEGDILECEISQYTKHNAVVRFGEYEQDGSGGEFPPTTCIGFYADAIEPDALDGDGYRKIFKFDRTSSLKYFSKLKIIGNVYENPELLRK